MYSTAAGRKFRSVVAVAAVADGGRRRPTANKTNGSVTGWCGESSLAGGETQQTVATNLDIKTSTL